MWYLKLTPTTNKPYFKNKKFYPTASFRALLNHVPSFQKLIYMYTYSDAYVLLIEYLRVNKINCLENP
jgi:hypothetical protein